ncbi:hypothetical protein BG015_008499 [Linnemannia schmuckeri]|uniref:Uncharacterized protein n=1 Tax=Linnemannia schmuckeri TaxID=64567 RepID=A0A9P5VFU0_9FUNG|nr:hypothetical protein BG015_008499 [Linnemannia schmuckeri]
MAFLTGIKNFTTIAAGLLRRKTVNASNAACTTTAINPNIHFKAQLDPDTLAKLASNMAAQRSRLNRVARTKIVKDSHHCPKQVNTSDTRTSFAQIKDQVRHVNSTHDKIQAWLTSNSDAGNEYLKALAKGEPTTPTFNCDDEHDMWGNFITPPGSILLSDRDAAYESAESVLESTSTVNFTIVGRTIPEFKVADL